MTSIGREANKRHNPRNTYPTTRYHLTLANWQKSENRALQGDTGLQELPRPATAGHGDGDSHSAELPGTT